ncbi:MAG: Cof-type HAD-IIB family hydrolase [Clostridia bacterium]|nr:Cof-type HAD-IIB family hydrolase [Clostridia bacterium]
MNKVIFSDVDGTLLNDDHQLTDVTRDAVRRLLAQEIPFVVVSARSPGGIFPILDDLGIRQPIIAHGGSQILDENRNTIHSETFPMELAVRVTDYIDNSGLDACWNAFQLNDWMVRDKTDPKLLEEEAIVRAKARACDLRTMSGGINKILVICREEHSEEMWHRLAETFPELDIVRSGRLNIEVMPKGITKGTGAAAFCRLRGLDLENAWAFGDQYNDLPMLRAVGHGYLMDSAPDALKDGSLPMAPHNNDNGLAQMLARDGLV